MSAQITKELSCRHIVGQYTLYPLLVLEASLHSGRMNAAQAEALRTRRALLKTRQPEDLPTFGQWCEDLAQHLNETTEDRRAWVRYSHRANGTRVCCVLDG